jgi:tRNA-splicing ligase RtcB
MRADPYQARARALALEAGLDPDAKIDRLGQRPMPTWCTFRDGGSQGAGGGRNRCRRRHATAPGTCIPERAAQGVR